MPLGTVTSYSTDCGMPRRLEAFTVTTCPSADTSMRSRLECSACSRTSLRSQARTAISPPQLLVSSPESVGAIPWGTVRSSSTDGGRPRRLEAFTVTTCRSADTSMRSRLECWASGRTSLRSQARTAISPPKLLISSRLPGRTAKVVSVCCRAARAARARVGTNISLLLDPLRDAARLAQQLDFAPHRFGEMVIQVRVAGILRQRPARLRDGRVDRRETVLEHPDGQAVEPPGALALVQRALQLGDGAVVRRIDRADPPHAAGPGLRDELAAARRGGAAPSGPRATPRAHRQRGAPRAQPRPGGPETAAAR